MKLPSGNVVTNDTPIYPGSNFNWGEATKNGSRYLQDLVIRGRLIVTARQIEKNIVMAAMAMDGYRARLGNRPIQVNSWYRPSHINRRVGGNEYSRHQYGDAIDWVSDYFSPAQIAKILESDHYGGGYKAYYGFTHTDWRGEKARW